MFSFYEPSRSTKYGRTSTNMYLQFKWDVENYANHRFNVITAKPSIDTSAPLTFTHMFVRPKKLQLELERYSQIQRNNRFLLERLATIHREGAWIDNKNYHEIKSLNTWKRQQEMINLAYNNQIMIARLHDVKAKHNRNRLEDEYLMNQKYKATIRKCPPNWRQIQERMDRLRDDIFQKIFDYKYQKKEYEKSRKKVLDRWKAETEKHAAAKAKRIAAEEAEAERQEQLIKEKKKEAAKERKKAMEELNKKTAIRKAAREERLKLAEELKKKKQEKEAQSKKKKQEVETKRREKIKEKIEAEKKFREEKRKQEENKKRNEEMKRTAAHKKYKVRLTERHTKKTTAFDESLVKNFKVDKDKQIRARKTIREKAELESKETATEDLKKSITDVDTGKVSSDPSSDGTKTFSNAAEPSDMGEERSESETEVRPTNNVDNENLSEPEISSNIIDPTEERSDGETNMRPTNNVDNESQSESETSSNTTELSDISEERSDGGTDTSNVDNENQSESESESFSNVSENTREEVTDDETTNTVHSENLSEPEISTNITDTTEKRSDSETDIRPTNNVDNENQSESEVSEKEKSSISSTNIDDSNKKSDKN